MNTCDRTEGKGLPTLDGLSVVAHELRGPLTCIEGYTAMLQSPGLEEGARERYLERLLAASRWAAALVANLQDAADWARGRFVLNPSPVVMAEIIEETIEGFRVRCTQGGITISADLASAGRLPAADSCRLRQVLHNLLANALKYVPSGHGHIRVSLRESGSWLLVSVADNGTGIAPGDIPYLFEKGYQAARENHGSMGLGLYLARAIVEAHGGKIWAESDGRGRGAVFYVRLSMHGALTQGSGNPFRALPGS